MSSRGKGVKVQGQAGTVTPRKVPRDTTRAHIRPDGGTWLGGVLAPLDPGLNWGGSWPEPRLGLVEILALTGPVVLDLDLGPDAEPCLPSPGNGGRLNVEAQVSPLDLDLEA